MTLNQKIRIQHLDSINCSFIDFLLFYVYMIGPERFKRFALTTNKDMIDEVQLRVVMKRLNLWVDLNIKAFSYSTGILVRHYEYQSVMTM